MKAEKNTLPHYRLQEATENYTVRNIKEGSGRKKMSPDEPWLGGSAGWSLIPYIIRF